MSRVHIALISTILAIAAGAGAMSVLTTSALGKPETKPEVAATAAIHKRERQLQLWEKSINRSLEARPPALPAVPRFASIRLVHASPGAALPTLAKAAPAQTTASDATPESHASRPVKISSTSARTTAVGGPRIDVGPPTKEQPPKDPTVAPATPAPPATSPPPPPAPPAATPAPAPPPPPPPPPASTESGREAAKQDAERQCEALKRAAEGKGEAAKREAEQQCERLKAAAEDD
jgi:hypothetical protein